VHLPFFFFFFFFFFCFIDGYNLFVRVAGFVSNDIIEGKISSNPFVYGTNYVKSFEYQKNGYPVKLYEPDYNKDDFLDVYFSFLKAIGAGNGDIDIGMTVRKFET